MQGEKAMSLLGLTAKSMKMAQIKEKAIALGVNPGKMKKTELIRAIQQAEGNNTCYGYSNGQCQNAVCCFFTDCLKIKT